MEATAACPVERHINWLVIANQKGITNSYIVFRYTPTTPINDAHPVVALPMRERTTHIPPPHASRRCAPRGGLGVVERNKHKNNKGIIILKGELYKQKGRNFLFLSF